MMHPPYPKTPIKPVTDTIFGHTITDNYRWLETPGDLPAERRKVWQWVHAQNQCTQQALNFAYKSTLRKELRQLLSLPFNTCPVAVKGKYFWEERKANEDQYVLYWRQGLKGKPQVVYNPNGRHKDNVKSINFWSVSPSGAYITYGLTIGGTEVSTMHIKNLATGKELETIPYIWQSAACWLPDESGFFYCRLPKPGTVPKGEELYHRRVRFHKLGTDSKDDPIIFGEGRHKEDTFALTLSTTGEHLLIFACRNWTQNEVWLYNTNTQKIKPLITSLPHTFSIHQANGSIFCCTNYKANNYRVLRASLTSPPKNIDDWEELLPEQKHALQSINLSADTMFTTYTVDVCSRVDMYTHAGKKIGTLPIPKLGALSQLTTRTTESEFFFATKDLLNSKTIYRYDPVAKKYSVHKKPLVALSPKEYTARQVWCRSSDGQKVPLFIVHKKDIKLDGTNPTLLYGYGGFNVSVTPSLPFNYMPLLKRGLVCAIANIRGGGEFGADWHKSAILQHKQRSFDDFIAASEYLINKKYTQPNKLAILGGSNGGLLVGACAVQRPDLYKAVVSAVPLLDMVRFPYYLIASRWVHEYGDPRIKKEFQWIIKWSPYHNVKQDTTYPSFLLKTSDNDSRVHPMHAWKMAALLQAHSKSNVVLLHTEIDSGHGAGTPKTKTINELADTLTFLAWQLGIADHN